MSSKTKLERTTHLEFGGVLGAPFMIVGLPLTVYWINLACNQTSCDFRVIPSLPNFTDLLDWNATLLFLAWFSMHIILSLLPVGRVVEGLPLRTGNRLKYRCNGLFAMTVSMIGFAVLVYLGVPITIVYEKFLALATAAIGFSLLLSVYLYLRSFSVPNYELARGGNSGHMLYDFFIGRELNPRIGNLDLKYTCELRPGLIGWVILDLVFCVAAYEKHGFIPSSLILVTAFHFLYVTDSLWNEEAILSTMDIVHDGFGFMLAFGDLVWVPFLYCLQARYLLEHPTHWSMLGIAALAALNFLGYVIFRGSNSQKNAFRNSPNDPTVAHLKTMPTTSGKKLLISGWWGICRHPNYLGDLIMALSWSLPCGFNDLLPYFYPIYFLVLLLHRERRDEANCIEKYGADWSKYCKIVPYRIFPKIY